MNTYIGTYCPKCRTENVTDHGDTNDLTGYDPEYVQCYKCDTIYQLDNEDNIYTDNTNNIYPNDGDTLAETAVCSPDAGMRPPTHPIDFSDLPICFYEREKVGEWSRPVVREGTISELLEIWDIDDEFNTSEMAQVLRHLRKVCIGE